MATDSDPVDAVRHRLHRIQGAPPRGPRAPADDAGDRMPLPGRPSLDALLDPERGRTPARRPPLHPALMKTAEVGGPLAEHVVHDPGAYTRGALAGRPGKRMSSPELIASHGGTPPGPVRTAVTDVLTDPYTWALGGAQDVLAGGRALSRGAGALAASENPLARALGRLATEESGKLDWEKFGRSLGSPTVREGFRQLGPDEYFRRNLGYGIEETPAHQFDVLADRMGVPLHWASPGDYQAHLGDFRPASEYPYASYVPVGPGKWNKSIAIPTTRQMWWDPFTMKREMLTSGNPKVNPAFDPADMASQPILRPWLSTSDPRHVAVHELMHALHHREVGTPTFGTLQNDQVGAALVQELQDKISRYALTNPLEAVAETGTKGILRPQGSTLLQAIPAPIKKAYGRDWWGPNIPKAKKDMGL